MNRGSEWRIWDLHIHTPETAKNNQYGNADEAWPAFIDKLEALNYAVYGITDYFSIKNYLKVKCYQDEGRLQNCCILPNVEMRIEPVTGKGTPINIHAILDPSLSNEDIVREFFRALKFKYNGSEYSCCNTDLIAMGRAIKDDCQFPEQAAINVAIGEMVISYSDLRAVIEKPFFRGRIIIALSNSSNDGDSGLHKHEGGLGAVRSEIYKMSDIILSGNPKDIDYFLGRTTSVEEVIKNCGSIKPCITGTDAHSLDKVGVFTEGRKTWIKADPTFEGLKQILFEPEDRVRICDSKPEYKYDYDVIDKIVLNSANTWHQTIYLNQNLNSIIGGRSTGKSTLLASIAAAFNCTDDVDNRDYIHQLRDSVHVYWRDGQENGDKYIEYFPQNKISKVAEPQETDKLLMDILLGKEDVKIEYEKHKSLLASRFSTIQTNVALYFEKRRLYREKIQYIKGIGDDKGIRMEIKKLEDQRNDYQSKITDKKELLDTYINNVEEIRKKQLEKSLLLKESDALKLREQDSFIVQNRSISISDLTSEHSSKLAQSIKSIIDKANSEVQETIRQILTNNTHTISEIDTQIINIQSRPAYKEGKQIFEANKSLTDVIKQLDELNKKLALITRETEVAQKIRDEFKELGQNLLSLHCSYLDAMNNIAFKMRLQYEDVRLTSAIVLKPNFSQALSECISLRSVAMNELIDNVVKGFNKQNKTDIENSLKDILNKALRNEIPFKAGYDAQSFMSRILSENWFGLSLNVEYDGDNLRDMSPGKRSFVVLKLLLDFSDKKSPILIDQPEDNLDNRAIYSDLVRYIRKKKKDRQIILVTHNPNIVVGADSEEVIIANQNGKNAPNENGIKFQYLCGSLENSKDRISDETIPMLNRCGVREHVCDILEGGENAFKERENKYGFFKI